MVDADAPLADPVALDPPVEVAPENEERVAVAFRQLVSAAWCAQYHGQ